MPERFREMIFGVSDSTPTELEPVLLDFEDVIRDRRRVVAEGDVLVDRVQGISKELEKLPAEKKEIFKRNLALAKMLNGHRGAAIRGMLQHAKGVAAEYVREVFDWSHEMAITGEFSLEDKILENPPELISEANEPEGLYERLVFSEKNLETTGESYDQDLAQAVARAIGAPEGAKWTDMIDVVFSGDDPKDVLGKLISEVGFIPQEFYSKKKFRGLGADKILPMFEALRDVEHSKFRPQARYERAKLINAFVTSGNANSLRKGGKGARHVTLDTNGIRIDLRGFHTHLPYGLVGEGLVNSLEEQSFVSNQHELTEIKIRRAEENSEIRTEEEIGNDQVLHFAEVWGIDDDDPERIIDILIGQIRENTHQFALKVVHKDLVVPDTLIDTLVEREGEFGTFTAVRLAEAIGAEISGERLTRQPGLFSSYELLHEQEESYEARSALLNEPDYYNALKVARKLLDKPMLPHRGAEERFFVLRGKYKKTRGEQHTFVEAVYRDDVARVLVNEDKHLQADQQQGLERIPLFERDEYERLEKVLRSFDYYTTTIRNIQKTLDTKKNKWPERFSKLSETALYFLLSNETTEYKEAKTLFESMSKDEPEEAKTERFVELLERSRIRYADFLYQNIRSVSEFREHFEPEVNVVEVEFGQTFLDDAKANCPTYGYDEQLSREAPPMTVVKIDYKKDDPTGNIPYHIEESCLEKMGIDRERPLINVIGGCRYVGEIEDPSDDPLNKMATAVTRVAHKHRANVGIPGTQSGIGVNFGRQYIHYKNRTAHLAKGERAHFFSITPGGNTHFPGNEYSALAHPDERFAITPVDSTAVTPFAAEWEREGMDRLDSPYREHVEYMEALYARMSLDEPQVMVVGNGGLYSIMEINASLKYGFDLILLRDSGRFAEVAAMLVDHLDELDMDQEEDIFARILELIDEKIDPEVAKEYKKKDFGAETVPENDNYKAYRIFFLDYLKLARANRHKIRLTDVANLENDLDSQIVAAAAA